MNSNLSPIFTEQNQQLAKFNSPDFIKQDSHSSFNYVDLSSTPHTAVYWICDSVRSIRSGVFYVTFGALTMYVIISITKFKLPEWGSFVVTTFCVLTSKPPHSPPNIPIPAINFLQIPQKLQIYYTKFQLSSTFQFT